MTLKLKDQAEYFDTSKESQDASHQSYQFQNICRQEEKAASHLKDKARVQTGNVTPNNSAKEKCLGKNGLQKGMFKFGKEKQRN